MDLFYDEYMQKPQFPENFDKATVRTVLEKFLASYDPADDSAIWFEKVKAITTEIGFTTDMKAFKADPTAFPGTVADVSTFIRLAVTGKTNAPDLHSVMQILGAQRSQQRIRAAMELLA
jgi:glutamyl-tRNA synthetase